MRKAKINVLYVHTSLSIGGAQAVRYMFLKYLSSANFNVAICCLGEKGLYGEKLQDLGYKIEAFNRKYHLFHFLTTFKLYKYIKVRKFDIVHSSLFFANYHAALAALMARVPILIMEEHGEHSFHLKKRHFLHRIIGHYVSQAARIILCCSDQMKQEVAKVYNIPSQKILVMKNMIDDKRLEINLPREAVRDKLGFDMGSILIGTVASLGWIKNHKFLIDGFAKVNKNGVFLILVGDGPLRQELEDYVSGLSLNHKVHFLGWREDIANILNAIDIFVLTSISEGLPIALLEAMSIGLPCIVTRVGGMQEVLTDNITGRLVAPGNTEELLGALNQIIYGPEVAKKIGLTAREYVLEKFKPSNYINQILELYNRLAIR